ncbi:MAG: ankyrin repeat domain-containing protein [Candidatus Babeliales bacterium]
MKITVKKLIISTLLLFTSPLFCNKKTQENFWKALETNDGPVLEAAINAGANVNKPGGTSGMEPLLYAITFSSPEIVKLLLTSNKVDLNKLLDGGNTPLITAVKHNKPTVVKLLLADKRVDPNKKNKIGDTPFMEAITTNNPTLFFMFLDNDDVNINTIGSNGETPLTYFLSKKDGSFFAIIQRLLDYEADPNKANKKGMTPLAIAIEKNQPKIVELLLQYQADPYKESKGDTALEIADEQGNKEIVALIENTIRAKQEGTSQILKRRQEFGPDVSRLIEKY